MIENRLKKGLGRGLSSLLGDSSKKVETNKVSIKDIIRNKRGRIINISSISGTDGNKGQSNYAASKGGLLAFTKSLAKEVGKRNITVNCIAPGIIETDMIFDLSDTVKTDYLRRIPLKKFGKPEDISKMILFLCSDEASYITGQTFYIDGGMSLNWLGVKICHHMIK